MLLYSKPTLAARSVEILLQLVPRVRPLQRADPRIVKHQLQMMMLRMVGPVGELGDATLASVAQLPSLAYLFGGHE